MTEADRREAARRFINQWRGKGGEKQDSQKFWVSLLHDVYGLDDITKNILVKQSQKCYHKIQAKSKI